MDELTRVKTILADHMDELRREYNVGELGVFGSTARGDNRADSDVDILISFNGKAGLFLLMRLKHRLEEILEKEVDVGTKESLKAPIKDKVLSETQYVGA